MRRVVALIGLAAGLAITVRTSAQSEPAAVLDLFSGAEHGHLL
jgi:hypothetical protein